MTQFRPYSRRVLHSSLRKWARAYAKEISTAVLVLFVILAIETFLIVGAGEPSGFDWFVLGVVNTLLTSALLAGLGLVFLVSDRTAINLLRGAWGEENTRDALKSAKRKGHVWGWIDSVSLDAGDIDHIVLSRLGGLLAIDSKWRTRVDTVSRDSMVLDALHSRRRAEGVVRTVLTRDRPGRRADGKSLRVRPVVVVWGSAQHSLPSGTIVEGVDFVRGTELIRWLSDLEGDPIEQEPARELLGGLREYRAKSWKE